MTLGVSVRQEELVHAHVTLKAAPPRALRVQGLGCSFKGIL